MTGRHPRSLLFPYTTLFRFVGDPLDREHDRSCLAPRSLVDVGADDGREIEAGGEPVEAERARVTRLVEAERARRTRLARVRRLDRKSTRLNSSHANISYAVF